MELERVAPAPWKTGMVADGEDGAAGTVLFLAGTGLPVPVALGTEVGLTGAGEVARVLVAGQ